jgi:thioredoxin reductase
MFDVVIAGGGPAGLSAALVLGRMRRRVLVCDTGAPRNAPAHAAQSVFTRDGTPPAELLRIGREQLRPYDTVELRHVAVVSAQAGEGGFEVELADGAREQSRRLLLATGVVDELPAVEGMAELWGKGVYHCPYCHGWEVRDQPLAVFANGAAGVHVALLLSLLSTDIVICTNGPADFSEEERRRLAARGIAVREEAVVRLEGTADSLERVIFATGEALPRRGLFVPPGQHQHSDLAVQLGCASTEEGFVQVDESGQTTVRGVYAAGDMITRMQQQVIHAAAAGARAAAAINGDLLASEGLDGIGSGATS